MIALRRILGSLVAATALAAVAACAPTSTRDDLVRVPEDAATLTEAAERVAPGGMILIAAGTYEEQVLIDTADVTVRGADRNATIIDGGGTRAYGIVVTADGVRVENLTITGATFYGLLFTGLHDETGPSAPTANGYERWDPAEFPPLKRFLVDHVTAHGNGLYGVYAFNARHGEIRDSYASGSADSGFYVGQCEQCDILVTGNVAERNAVGFENANASDSVVVVGNRFAGNRVGMTLLSSHQEAFTPQRGNVIVGNLISDNVQADSPAQADGGFAIGVGISGGQDNVLVRNRITGNPRAGVVLANMEDLPAAGNRFTGNVLDEDGAPDAGVSIANVSAARTPATGNCAEGALVVTLPVTLAEELAAACAGSTAAQTAASAALPGPEAPPGVSFLRVAAPRPQPNLPLRSAYAPLPASVTMPDLERFDVPPADLFANRAGTR